MGMTVHEILERINEILEMFENVDVIHEGLFQDLREELKELKTEILIRQGY